MNSETAGEVLREFSEHRAKVVDGPHTEWKWSAGVVLFPDALCPWCGEVMHSNRIWLVNERMKKLDGQVALVEDKLVLEPPSHPHVRSGGYICMNSARDAYSALFLGMNFGHSHMQNDNPRTWQKVWKAWNVRMFDHACDAERQGIHGVAGKGLSVRIAED